MAEYIDVEIDEDEGTLYDSMVARFQEAFPQWNPLALSPIALLFGAVAFVLGEILRIIRLTGRSIFGVYLREVANIPRVEATPSTATATFVSTTATDYTVEAGVILGISDGAGLVAFEVVEDVTATGDTATGVQLISQEEGAFTAGLDGEVVVLSADAAAAYDPVVTLDDPTAGGSDGETEDEYLARGSERLQLSSDDVILGEDAAILARQVPGVWRAMAVDNYDVDTDDDEAEGMIALALQASDGEAVTDPVRDTVLELVHAATLLGLEVKHASPEATAVDVRFEYTTHAGYAVADVGDRAESNVEAYLSPAVWGSLPFGDARSWRPEPTVELYEVAEVILRTEGLDRIVPGTLEIREDGGSWGTSSVSLGSKPWSVVEPGSVTATPAS